MRVSFEMSERESSSRMSHELAHNSLKNQIIKTFVIFKVKNLMRHVRNKKIKKYIKSTLAKTLK